ncbi:MAG: acylphosphatase [Candidatus Latescibacteria bacterium]|jgi:acylphosphatase|nr:acylphosphatase [Candidatus Latescibacterota bacterium]
MNERKRIWLKVTGRVQGVGFRYFTRREAERLGLVGWVRNMPNGDVEAEAEGIPEQIDAFVASIRRGPSASRIAEIMVNDLPVLNGEALFEIRMF